MVVYLLAIPWIPVFIIRNRMCQMPVVRYDDISVIIKLPLDLFMNQNILHLILKIRGFPFQIILDYERKDDCLITVM